jgi:hypothetical protein
MFSQPIGQNSIVLAREGLDLSCPRSGRGTTRSRPAGRDPAVLDRKRVIMTWLEDWSTAESSEDLAVAVGGIRQRVAEQVVGLKPIRLFENEKYYVVFMHSVF